MSKYVTALLYHDVIDGTNPDVSGFPGKNSAEYKINRDEFERHILAIKQSLKSPVITQITEKIYSTPPVMLAFDDGGISCYEIIAPILEENGWRGIFFITTDCIGSSAFVNSVQIKELSDRGHVIGSHSSTHPKKITECTRDQLISEWSVSLKILSEILERPVTVASIPGGFFSKEVAETAIECGVKYLFTSEPVQKIWQLNECAIIGRFSVKRGDSASVAAEFASNKPLRIFRQYAYWNIKKVAKAIGGPLYPLVRNHYLSRK